MRISGQGNETFLFLNGLAVNRGIRLSQHVQLLPASCSVDPALILKLFTKDVDVGVAILFLGSVHSQIRVVAETSEELAKRAWNSVWDGVLISALFRCDAICNFQSDTPAEKLAPASNLRVTNYHLRGLLREEPRMITETDALWIEQNFNKARALLEEPAFQNAVHSLASYTWHSLPRAQLTLLWSGIEGLFAIDTELVFRLSLYAARFLEREDDARRMQVFKDVKRLYKGRSRAVHGSEMKGDANSSVNESADLLLKLIRRCIENNSVPNLEALAP